MYASEPRAATTVICASPPLQSPHHSDFGGAALHTVVAPVEVYGGYVTPRGYGVVYQPSYLASSTVSCSASSTCSPVQLQPPQRRAVDWLIAEQAVPCVPAPAAAPRKARRAVPPFRARVEWDMEIRDAWSTLDIEGSGFINRREMKAGMRALGFAVRKQDVIAAMRDHGILPRSGGADDELDGRVIDFETFRNMLLQRYVDRDPLDATLGAFGLFDGAGRGRISVRDLRRAAKELSVAAGRYHHVEAIGAAGSAAVAAGRFQEERLQEMLAAFDTNRDGEIDEAEFAHVMAMTSLH